MVQVHLGLIHRDDLMSKLETMGVHWADVSGRIETLFSSVVESYSETLMESTVHSFENRFSQVEGMNDDISVEILGWIRSNYGAGPDFHKLRKHLHKKFEISYSSKLFSQLEVVFRESVMEGFSGVIHSSSTTTETEKSSSESSSSSSESSSSTTTTTGGTESEGTIEEGQGHTETSTEEGETKTGGTTTGGDTTTTVEKTFDAKSMMVMEFTDVTMSSAYNNNQFPARNVLADDGTFFHTDRGVGQFWEGKFANGMHTITQVRIKNRGDCCSERLSKTKVFIGTQLCGMIPQIPTGRAGKWYTLECKNPIIGNAIKFLTTTDTYLHFSRLEVYGLKKEKLAKPQGASKFVAQSAGEEYGLFSAILINDEQIVTDPNDPENGGRGFNIVAVESRTHNVLIKRVYDTSTKAADSRQLARDLYALPAGTIIMAAVKEDASQALTTRVQEFFSEQGSKEIFNLDYQDHFVFIGVKDQNKFTEKRGPGVGVGLILSFSAPTKEVREQVEVTEGGSRIEFESAGYDNGNFASVYVENDNVLTRE